MNYNDYQDYFDIHKRNLKASLAAGIDYKEYQEFRKKMIDKSKKKDYLENCIVYELKDLLNNTTKELFKDINKTLK